jgi:adenylyltransferase/sulfurtransferase
VSTKGPHPRLSPAALAEIYAHARRDYPSECCGIVFGGRGQMVADQVKPCRNIQDQLHAEDPELHPRTSYNAYNLEPSEIFALEKSLRGERPAKIVYHSHIDVGAYFSDTDQAAATFGDEPAYDVEYVVVDVKKDGTHGARQFAWDDEVRKYVEVDRYE